MDSETEQNPNSRPDSPSSSIAAWSPVPMNFIRSPSYSPTSPTYILTSPDDSPRSPSYSPSPIYTPYDLGSPATIVLNSEDSDYISSPDYDENSLDNRFSVVFSPSPQHLDATQDSQYGPSSPDSLRSVSPIAID
uniref:Uncharacterized protein n=1 Tax=Acrobeloides nanus TaxID=290746 RepID=A0A914CRX8_9BILA